MVPASSSSCPPPPTQDQQEGQVDDDTADDHMRWVNADSVDVVVVAVAAAVADDPDDRHPIRPPQIIVGSNSGQRRLGSDGIGNSAAVASVAETTPSCYYQYIVAAGVEGSASFETS